MTSYKYTLEPYTGISKTVCPGCNKRKCFTRYIEKETGKYIHESVGICDHAKNCGYHKTPKQFFSESGLCQDKKSYSFQKQIEPTKNPDFLPFDIMKKSLQAWDKNNFVKWLISLFGIEETEKICKAYFIGSSKHWKGSTMFWQIDINGNLRNTKIMLYNPENGKRIKEGAEVEKWDYLENNFKKENTEQDCSKVYGRWLDPLKTKTLNLVQCFFGEHLINRQCQKIGIVESEKTAMILSFLYPEYTWISKGSDKGGCKWTDYETCKILKNKKVVLFPDKGIKLFQLWKQKANEIMSKVNCSIVVSDILEAGAICSEINEGEDLADYFLKNALITNYSK